MARLEIDTDDLNSADQQAFQDILRSEAARLEAEQREARERTHAWDTKFILDKFANEDRERIESASRVARMAKKRVRGAMSTVADHLTRAETPGISKEIKAAEEGLALASLRRHDEWSELERRATAQATVHEPAIYSRTSPNSYFADCAAAIDETSPNFRGALDRLERYAKGLARDFSAEGVRAHSIWREHARKPNGLEERSREEYRAMTTGSASGGSMVTPLYVVEDYAIYRSASPTFADYLVTRRRLPDYGMSINVPKFTGGGTVAADTENVAPTETDPTAGYQPQNINLYAGVVSASQQLHDRGGPLDFDTALYAQLRSQLDANVDLACITLALAGATTVTRTIATLTLPMFLSDIGQASAKLQTTAGVRLPPSGIAAAANISEWLLAQVTSNGDAWFKPSLGGMRTDDGVTGQAVSGIGLYVDDNIPAASSNAQLIVANKSSVFLYSGEPRLDVYQEGGLAGSLGVTYRLRQYAVPVGRFSAGVAVISGTGYPASPTFA